MLNRQFYTPVLEDMKRRRAVIDKAITALESLMTEYHYCEPLKTEHLMPFAGKWIAVDRSGDEEMVVGSGDTQAEVEALVTKSADVVFQEVCRINAANWRASSLPYAIEVSEH